MTDDYPMGALSPTCKPDDADTVWPLIVLLPPQAAISVEIADDGNVILRQECALGGDPDQIVIARANLSAFLEALIDITPHGRGWYDPDGVSSAEPEATDIGSRDDLAAKGAKGAVPTSSRRSPAAERQRRCRARKRAAATGGTLPSDWSPLDAAATVTPDRSLHLPARHGSMTLCAATPTD